MKGKEITMAFSFSGLVLVFRLISDIDHDNDIALGDFQANTLFQINIFDLLPPILEVGETNNVILHTKFNKQIKFVCSKPGEVPDDAQAICYVDGEPLTGSTAKERAIAVIDFIMLKMNLETTL
jgi:hypothetical protein